MRDFSILVKSLMTDDGYFNFYVPLSMLLGFCKDYKCVVITEYVNMKLEFTRSM